MVREESLNGNLRNNVIHNSDEDPTKTAPVRVSGPKGKGAGNKV
jgi:hypothetical protein